MQKQIRAESYGELLGALNGGTNPSEIGQRVVCPKSVRGSRRYMHSLFLDCMAIVRTSGSPHLLS